jgi:HK97 family phage prohead protease
MPIDKEYKTLDFKLTEVKEITQDGIKYGCVKGLFSTYGNVDEVGDKVMPGAFSRSITKYKELDQQIPLLYMHRELIGGIPVLDVEDSAEGLKGTAWINLEVQRGREAYAFAKQKVIKSFSIGYSTVKSERDANGVRELREVELFEISMVPNPANLKAKITDVKAIKAKKSYPLAPESHAWDKDAAIARIRKFTGSEEKPSASYKKAFMWHDKSKADDFTAYKLPYLDVVDGKLKAVPRAIFAIAAALEGARGGVEIPETDKKKIRAKVNRYYELMDKESPLKKKFINLEGALEIKSKRDFEHFLRESGACTRKAAEYLSKYFANTPPSQGEPEGKAKDSQLAVENIVNTLRETTERLKNANRN